MESNHTSPGPLNQVVGQLLELRERATQGRWEHIKRDITLDSVHCLGEPVAVRLYAADAAIIVAAINALPSLLAIAEAAAVVSAQRNGPYLMAGMEATLKAENDLRTALSLLPNTTNQPRDAAPTKREPT